MSLRAIAKQSEILQLLRSIDVLLVMVFALFSFDSLYSQPKGKTEIKLSSGSKFTLHVTSIADDTAHITVSTKGGHAVPKLSAEDFLVIRDDDTAVILSCRAMRDVHTDNLAITFILDNSGSMF